MAVMKFVLRSPLPRTLRGRLIAGLVALLTIGCATVGLVTYAAVQRTLSSEFTNNLQTATGLAYKCWEQQFNQEHGNDGGQGQGDNEGQGQGNDGDQEQADNGGQGQGDARQQGGKTDTDQGATTSADLSPSSASDPSGSTP